MEKIYISGKITGTKDYKARFRKVEKMLRNKGLVPVNPARVNGELPPETEYNDYRIMSLTMLSSCDSIYLMHGYWKSGGAMMERTLAEMKKMKIIYGREPVITWRNYFVVRKLRKERRLAADRVRFSCQNGKRLVEIVREEAASWGLEEADVLNDIDEAAERGADFSWCANLKQIEDRLLQHKKEVATRAFKETVDRINEIKASTTLGVDGMKALKAKEARENGSGN